jgi:hypothetical protein
MTEPVQVRRDPFARMTMYRKVVFAFLKSCAWCGRFRKTPRLFCYGWEQDGINTQIEWDKHLFCSIECRDTFYRG